MKRIVRFLTLWVFLTSVQCTVTPMFAQVVAIYDAGVPGAPANAPDPTSAGGGTWTLNNTTVGGGVGFSWGEASPDGAFPYNAWHILDNTNGSGQFIYYFINLTLQQEIDALNYGCTFTSRLRMQDPVGTNAGTSAIYVSLGVINGARTVIFFDINASGDLVASLQGTGGSNLTLTSGGVGATNYHLHEIVFDPASKRFSYRFDGVTKLTGWTGTTGTTRHQVTWGTESSGGRGEGWFNFVKFEIAAPPPAPGLVQSPASTTNSTGDKVTLTAVFTNLVTSLKWYKDLVEIPGATASNYTIPFVTVRDEGSYYAEASNITGTTNSAAAYLHVLPDNIRPTITSNSVSIAGSRVRLHFSEPVEEISAADPINYQFQNGSLTTVSATRMDPFTVNVVFTPTPVAGSNYVLLVTNVLDYASNSVGSSVLVNCLAPSGFVSVEKLVAALTPASITANPLGGVDWMDLAGGENHALNTSTNPTAHPVMKPGSLNGYNTVAFNPSLLQSLVITGATSTALDLQDYTWFVVCKVTNIASGITPNVIRHQTTFSGANWGSFFFFGNADTGNQMALTANGRNAGAGAVETRAFPASNSVWMILSGRSGNGAVSGPELRSRIYYPEAGVAYGTNFNPTALVYGSPPIATWIGWVPSAATAYFGGEMAEVLLYTGEMQASELQDVESYLKAKYFPPRSVISINRNGVNLDIAYTGILEGSTAAPGPYSPLGTNATQTPVIYSIPPASQQSQQYFRARNP